MAPNFVTASFPNLIVIQRNHSFDVLSSTSAVTFDDATVFAISEKHRVLNEFSLPQ